MARITHRNDRMHRGTVPTNQLGTGSASATTFLRGDQTWAVPSGGSSFGSNSNSVGLTNAPGASSSNARADHVHQGVHQLTSNGSNGRFEDVNLAAGSGIALGVSGQTVTITNTGTSTGGAAGSTDAILGQSGQGGARISGLQGSADIDVAGTNDEEFNTTDTGNPPTGWTALGTLSAVDINSTAKSHLRLYRTAATTTSVGIYKAAPATPFTITAKLSGARFIDTNFMRAGGIFVSDSNPAAGNALMVTPVEPSGGAKFLAMKYVNNTFSSTLSNLSAWSQSFPVYLQIVVTSATAMKVYFSYDGHAWTPATASDASINPGLSAVSKWGLWVETGQGTYDCEAFFDWVRFT